MVGEVRNVGNRSNHRHIEFAFKAFLHNLHVQHSEESASKSKAQCRRGFGLIGQRSVVEAQFFESTAEFFELLIHHRINSRKNHGLHVFKTGNSHSGRIGHSGYGVADLDLFGLLNSANDVAHVACSHAVARLFVKAQNANFVGKVGLARSHKFHGLALSNRAVFDAENGLDSAEGIVDAVKNNRLKGGRWVAFRGRNLVYNGLKKLGNAEACFCRNTQNIFALAAKKVDDLVFYLFGVGAGQVHFIEYRNDFEVVLNGQIKVAYGLGLNSLSGVYYQKGSLAGGDAAANLVAKVNVARSVYEVQAKLLTAELVVHLNGMALYGNAAFPLQIHVVEQLLHLLARRYALGFVE